MQKPDYMTQIEKKSTVQIVIDRLSSALIEGQLNPGDKLPAEDVLAASFHVSRNTVREAVRTLVAYGILEVRRPSGTFVCTTFNPQGLNPLVYGLILKKKNSYDELIGFREMLDIGLAFVLMSKGLTPEDEFILRSAAKKGQDALVKSPVDIEALCDADIEFHLSLAKVADNSLLLPIHEMMARLTRASRYANIANMLKDGREQFMIDTHYKMIDCLKGSSVESLYHVLQDSLIDWKHAYQ